MLTLFSNTYHLSYHYVIIYACKLGTLSLSHAAEVSIEYTQLSVFAIEGEPIVFLTLIRHGISYINILLNFTSHSDTATG